MANRNFVEFQKTLSRGVVSLYAKINIGATGAVSSVQMAPGITSVARQSAGQYLIVLDDQYNALLCPSFEILNATAVDVGPQVVSETVSTTKQIVFRTLTGAVATDPPSGSAIFVVLILKNSTVLP